MIAMAETTLDEVKIQAVSKILHAILEAIREAGRLPSGLIYAGLIEKFPGMSLEIYQRMEETMIETGLVRKEGDILIWTG